MFPEKCFPLRNVFLKTMGLNVEAGAKYVVRCKSGLLLSNITFLYHCGKKWPSMIRSKLSVEMSALL
jgi:hypothetical protein